MSLPLWVALLILMGWITFSSSMVSLWEPEWDYFTAIYFYITSLTTIGELVEDRFKKDSNTFTAL